MIFYYEQMNCYLFKANISLTFVFRTGRFCRFATESSRTIKRTRFARTFNYYSFRHIIYSKLEDFVALFKAFNTR